jgi:Co/Zn/Cd efflux system component
MLTAHVSAADGADPYAILHAVDACLADDFDVEHSTIQVEHLSRPMESDAHA